MQRCSAIFERESLDSVEPHPGSKHKLCHSRSERASAFVAETYGWLTGNPGVFISALGPGAFSFCFVSKACHPGES
jgi:thiamine pyrophosphate-dependent acetolactate synthase large subunit-like protein